VRYVAREAKVLIEPSGAASVAGILQRHRPIDRLDRPIVAVLSGGNIALDQIAQILTG
jgi:threonine dehydratase